MKCKSCNEDVPQRFNHALVTNICPYCGQDIMAAELQSALADLRDVMQATEQYRAEIFDWLLSNYQLISKESEEYKALQAQAELANKTSSKQAIATVDPKTVALDKNGNQIGGAPIQDQSITNKFMQRAQVKPTDSKNLRDIVNQIKKGGTSSVGTSLTAEADPEEVAALDDQLFGGGGLGSLNGATDRDEYYEEGEDALPPIVEAMAAHAGAGPKAADYNARDVAALQQIHNKQKRASKGIASGGVGLIRR